MFWRSSTISLLLSMELCYTSVAVLLVLSLLAVCCSCESYRVQLNCLHVCMFMIGQCGFEYRTQPPSSTVYDCNPYQDNIVRILLTCIVRRQISVTDEFEVRWFKQNTTGGVEDLGRGDLDEALGNDWLSQHKAIQKAVQPQFCWQVLVSGDQHNWWSWPNSDEE